MKLLIVDDSNIIRSRIARIALHPRLSDITIVGLAKNGIEALELARRAPPDVVTMDLTMPEMDGTACITAMGAERAEVKIPAAPALGDKTTASAALKKGARAFLHKPFSDEQLVA